MNGRLERIIVPHTASGSQRDGGPSLNTEHDNATVRNLMMILETYMILKI